ncbi:hypothetical protein KIN20_011488 [Parelaphostrongylus tenuis]|uniref:Uncharacterized protein n=1 Tax=Parelaphostrongylus tenuis TaxID=148309 RepID=A0AAD5MVF0_PARTN|nr:hypothetical protein KIN20_011488 [Parelaphostrongylus tenuis]
MVSMMPDKVSQRCIIVDSTVTGICTATIRNEKACNAGPDMVALTSPVNYTSITGNLSMWQKVMNRAVRMLVTGPFKSHFFSATGTVS